MRHQSALTLNGRANRTNRKLKRGINDIGVTFHVGGAGLRIRRLRRFSTSLFARCCTVGGARALTVPAVGPRTPHRALTIALTRSRSELLARRRMNANESRLRLKAGKRITR